MHCLVIQITDRGADADGKLAMLWGWIVIDIQQYPLLAHLEKLCQKSMEESDAEKQDALTKEISRIVDTLDKLRKASGSVSLCRA